MHILCLDCTLAPAFATLGHTVTSLALPAGETAYEALAASLPQKPDCVIQQETLVPGERALVSGLENAGCPTLFVAVDAHLNLYWQRHYSRLFDAVLTPHRSLFAALPAGDAHPRVALLPHAGVARPWTPHAEREHPLAFCGRLTETRPARAWMVEFLRKHFGLLHREGLSFEDMLGFYSATRIVPNEAICFEVNFRLLEAASCGAAVITPECGPDQDAVFERGKEMLVYRNGAELHEHAARLLRNPAEAEALGRAAWERIHKEHLPEHRAAAVIAMLPDVARTRLTGDGAATAFWLAKTELLRNGYKLFPSRDLLRAGESLPQTPEVLGGALHLLGRVEQRGVALRLCRALLDANMGASVPECNATASACALRHGDFGLARRFWTRNEEAALPARPASSAPETPFALCLAWAGTMRDLGRDVRQGFTFSPESGHLPACSYEFLALAEFYDSKKLAVPKRAVALLAAYPAYAVFRLELLSRLAADEAADWRAHFTCGLSAIRLCREDMGMQELVLAALKAEKSREAPAFFRALAAKPAGAYMEETVARLVREARENASSKRSTDAV
jgi:hypothetical protein